MTWAEIGGVYASSGRPRPEILDETAVPADCFDALLNYLDARSRSCQRCLKPPSALATTRPGRCRGSTGCRLSTPSTPSTPHRLVPALLLLGSQFELLSPMRPVNHLEGECVRGNVSTNKDEDFFPPIEAVDRRHAPPSVEQLPPLLAKFYNSFSATKKTYSARMNAPHGADRWTSTDIEARWLANVTVGPHSCEPLRHLSLPVDR